MGHDAGFDEKMREYEAEYAKLSPEQQAFNEAWGDAVSVDSPVFVYEGRLYLRDDGARGRDDDFWGLGPEQPLTGLTSWRRATPEEVLMWEAFKDYAR